MTSRHSLPDPERIADYFAKDLERFSKEPSQPKAAAVRDAIRAIEAATDRPALIDLK